MKRNQEFKLRNARISSAVGSVIVTVAILCFLMSKHSNGDEVPIGSLNGIWNIVGLVFDGKKVPVGRAPNYFWFWIDSISGLNGSIDYGHADIVSKHSLFRNRRIAGCGWPVPI